MMVSELIPTYTSFFNSIMVTAASDQGHIVGGFRRGAEWSRVDAVEETTYQTPTAGSYRES